MFKNKLKFLWTIPLLMAFQCDDDFVYLEYNPYKTNVTPNLSFSVNDTIWIYGRTSSKTFDPSVNDSVFSDTPQDDLFSIYRCLQPTNGYNGIDAVDRFEIISDRGEVSFLASCTNAHVAIFPELEGNNDFYSYRIGLMPTDSGDYVISWRSGAEIQNPNRNEFIIEDYPIRDFPDEPDSYMGFNSFRFGFNSCGSVTSWSLDDSDKEYCFRVEQQ